ncbi:MAG: argininosuccinate lyase [Alphaproteobacteria bacterium]
MSVLQSKRNATQSDALFAFTNGIDQDRRLATQEIAVQKAWLRGLATLPGMFKPKDVTAIEAALDAAGKEIAAGTFVWNIRDEDIHMHLERYVTTRCGDLGKKMHAGRSRNDLIATTLRLYTRDIMQNAVTAIDAVICALADQATQCIDLIIPGATHLQHGQPVRLSHVLLGHAEALRRDRERCLATAATAMAVMPLGSAALAGTPLPLDLKKMATTLGFRNVPRNSYDAVGDRDFMLEALSTLALLGTHLSRLAEDCIYWASTPVGLMKLPKAWSTGSSIMPNKRNPDVPELTRGRGAHVLGALTDGFALVRTVPTSYGSDLHELKKTLMNATDEIQACLNIWPHFIGAAEFDGRRANALCQLGHILATEIADALVHDGAAFRDAYKAVAALVEQAESAGMQVHHLPLAQVNAVLQSHNISTRKDYRFDPLTAVERRNQPGGTARKQVLAALKALRPAPKCPFRNLLN